MHVQASLVGSTDMAVQERGQQLRQYDDQQQRAPERDARGRTCHDGRL